MSPRGAKTTLTAPTASASQNPFRVAVSPQGWSANVALPYVVTGSGLWCAAKPVVVVAQSAAPSHCQTGQLEHAEVLIEFGVELNDYSPHEDLGPPLFFAATHGQLDIVSLLLARGAQIDASYRGESPLHFAIANGHEAVALFLLERGARVESPTEIEKLLGEACFFGLARVARRLLDSSSPDVVHKHLFNTCPAGRGPVRKTFKLRGRAAVVCLLLERGADIDRPMHMPWAQGMSTLDVLAREDRPEELKKVVRKYLAMRVRRCVLGPTSEHPRRQKARHDLAPKIAAFLV